MMMPDYQGRIEFSALQREAIWAEVARRAMNTLKD